MHWFLTGLAIVLLALSFPFIPDWQTFIHMWRVETAASLLLLGTFCYVLFIGRRSIGSLSIERFELQLVLLPMIAMIGWSLASTLWAPSWKSSIHHALIWTEYVFLFVIFRQLLETKSGMKSLLSVFSLVLVIYSLPAIFEYAAYQAFGGGTTIGMRFAKFGEQVVTILPLLLLWVIRTRGKEFAIGVGVVTILWLLIFCSFGRANYLLFGAVVVAMFALVMISRRYRRYAPRFAFVIVILVAAPIPLQIFTITSAGNASTAIGRFTESEGIGRSNDFRKLMLSLSSEMIRQHPVFGIGADNFGFEVNKYRQAYGATHPDDPTLANAEDQIPNHAHNEFVQIAAELGIVGFLIIAWLVGGIMICGISALRNIRDGSLYPAAAVLGLAAFLASSAVSSYSFRVMQNGIVFFFVLAVATKGYQLAQSRSKQTVQRTEVSPLTVRLACVVGLIACVGLITYSAFRVASVAVTARANQVRSIDEARPLYELAMRLDDENPNAHHNYGMRLFRRRLYGAAIPYLQNAVDIGRAPSVELSYLASAKTLSGDNLAAEETMRFATELYPRSPFVLTRYSILLAENGRTAESERSFQRATEIDRRAAASWKAFINLGPKVLSEMAARDKGYLQVSELVPESLVYAVVTERYIKFPDERRFSLIKVVDDVE